MMFREEAAKKVDANRQSRLKPLASSASSREKMGSAWGHPPFDAVAAGSAWGHPLFDAVAEVERRSL